MLTKILVIAVLVLATTMIHAAAMILCIRHVGIVKPKPWVQKGGTTRALAISSLVLIMLIASVLEAGLWAMTYLTCGAIEEGLEKALYFSIVTYTTLGYGDIVVAQGWRVFASIEAATGIIMFGWTTALIIAAVQHVYLQQGQSSAQRVSDGD